MNEAWHQIPGIRRYEVSDLGNIRKDGELVAQKTWNRRRYVTIRRGRGDYMKYTTHSLVMLAFVGPRPDGMDICHGDNNPENNALSNLRYDTRSENLLDKIHPQDGPRGRSVTISVILDRSVAERIRVLAAMEAKSRSEWLRDFLNKHLGKPDTEAGAAS